jgi:carbon-monoxide dehydrogenase medium subunit
MTETILYSAQHLDEAYKILSDHAGVKVLAGGTDLMVLYTSGAPRPAAMLDIWRLDELRGIAAVDGYLKIGALCTFSQLIGNDHAQQYAPTLIEAARTIGAIQIQNRGTLGGNIVNGSPAGDSLPVLSAFDAELELGSMRGSRRVPFNKFYTGYRSNVMAEDELLINIFLPKQRENEIARFYKVGTRAAQAISKVVISARVEIDAEQQIKAIAIALGSVAPTVMRATATEQLLVGKTITAELIEAARRALMAEVKPISDVRSTEHYRRVVCGNLIAKFLRL